MKYPDDFINRIINGDCLEVMQGIPSGSIDMVLCDLPYGTTNIEWDKPLPLTPLWEQYERIIKASGVIALFSAQPFTTDLINSNRKLFRYEVIWEKTQPTGFLNAKKMPLRKHENILIFYKKLPTFNPQFTKVQRSDIGRTRLNGTGSQQYQKYMKPDWSYTENGERYPTDVIKFSNWNGALFGKTDKTRKHPTAKPAALFEYLIKTYTNEGDLVLDNCIGSGTTAVAAINTGRNFVGIELSKEYCALAEGSIEQAKMRPKLVFAERKS
jgi:site-specific DNA-methyltransferase (adenine-specific)